MIEKKKKKVIKKQKKKKRQVKHMMKYKYGLMYLGEKQCLFCQKVRLFSQ